MLRPKLTRILALPAVALAFQLASVPGAIAQQLEPRAYSNLPVGLNFLIAGYAHSQGDVLLDPSLPVRARTCWPQRER